MAFNLSWNTTQSGLVAGAGGWVISDQGRTIRFNVQNSANCGGSNSGTQSGVATATISTTERVLLGIRDVLLVLLFKQKLDRLLIFWKKVL
jgi:hypothetical protein